MKNSHIAGFNSWYKKNKLNEQEDDDSWLANRKRKKDIKDKSGSTRAGMMGGNATEGILYFHPETGDSEISFMHHPSTHGVSAIVDDIRENPKLQVYTFVIDDISDARIATGVGADPIFEGITYERIDQDHQDQVKDDDSSLDNHFEGSTLDDFDF